MLFLQHLYIEAREMSFREIERASKLELDFRVSKHVLLTTRENASSIFKVKVLCLRILLLV